MKNLTAITNMKKRKRRDKEMQIKEMQFKAYYTNNPYQMNFTAITWSYAAQIAESFQSMTQKLIKLERADI